MTSSGKVILYCGVNAATYRLIDISLESDAVFDKSDATTLGGFYVRTMLIPYQDNIYVLPGTQKDTT